MTGTFSCKWGHTEGEFCLDCLEPVLHKQNANADLLVVGAVYDRAVLRSRVGTNARR